MQTKLRKRAFKMIRMEMGFFILILLVNNLIF